MALTKVTRTLLNTGIADSSDATAITINSSENVTLAGTLTVNAGVVVDNFTLDGTTLALSSGNLTLDVAGNILLDSDNGQWWFNDGGTGVGYFHNPGTGLALESWGSDKDMFFKGNDGGSTITALTLDMSNAGAADFNSQINVKGTIWLNNVANTKTIGYIYDDNDDFIIRSWDTDEDIIFKGNDGGSIISALTLDMSAAGAATFNAGVTATAFSGPLTGNVTGNTSGTALTVTQAAQTAITSVGTLTGLAVNSGAANVVASFTSTDGYGAIQLVDNSGNVELTAVGNDFHIQNAGGAAHMIVENSGRITIGNNLPIWSGSYGGALFLKGNNATADRYAELTVVDSNGATTGTGLVVDNGLKVGIGTDNPSGKLEVYEQSAATLRVGTMAGSSKWQAQGLDGNAANPFWSFINDDNTGMWRATTDTLSFSTAGTERLRIDATGKVGIGNVNPQTPLHIEHATAPTVRIERTTGATSGSLGLIEFGARNIDDNLVTLSAEQDGATDAGKFTISTEATGGALTARMTIASTGTVSIAGNANLQGYTDQTSRFRTNSDVSISGGSGWFAPAASLHVRQSSADDNDTGLIVETTDDGERARIVLKSGSSVGDAMISVNYYGLGIGWTNDAQIINIGRDTDDVAIDKGNTPAADKLDVNGNIIITGQSTNTGYDRYFKLYGNNDPGSNANRWAGLAVYNNGGNNVNELHFFTGSGDGARAVKAVIDTGGNLFLGPTANDTDKSNKIIFQQYDSGTEAEGYVGLFNYATTSVNNLYIGGGSGSHNAAMNIAFNTAGDTTTRTGSERMRIDSAGAVEMFGRVAIGSAASNATIDNNYTTGGLDVAVGNGTKAFQVWDDNSTGTPRFIVERGGDVGIGWASPNAPLDIKYVDNTNAQRWSYGSSQSNFYLELDTAIPTGSVVSYNFNLMNNGTAYNNTLVLDRGKVGIGTASPERGLHVVGGIHMPNASVVSWDAADGNLRNAIYIDSGDDMIIGDTNFDDIYFSTGQKTKTVVIKQTTGNVGIGLTGPEFPLSISITTATTQQVGFEIMQTTSGNDARMRYKNSANSAYCQVGMEADATWFVAPWNGSSYAKILGVNNSGRVGIGVLTPQSPLQVYAYGSSSQLGLKSTLGLQIFDNNSSANNFTQIGFGQGGANYAPAVIASQRINAAGYGADELVFATRTATSDTQPTERMRIKADGSITTAGDISPGADVIMASGRGISFTASSHAGGMTSELLDDYEEGLHVTTITGSTSGSWTMGSYNHLAYTKVGRVVHIQGYIDVNGESSPSGQIQISLPFAVASLTDDSESACITVSMRSHGGSNIYNLTGAIVNEGYIRLLSINGSGVADWLDEGDVGSGWNIRIGGSYITSA